MADLHHPSAREVLRAFRSRELSPVEVYAAVVAREAAVALKEEQPIAGRSLRLGSLATEGHVADHTHPVTQRVYGAGAIVHARTTTPEFSSAAFTHPSG